MRFKNNKLFNWVLLIVMIALPIALFILPADFFDQGKSMCLSVLLLSETCYGCGMTRAIQHLLHFDLDGAMQFNKLSLIVLPLLIIIWLRVLRDSLRILRS